MRESILYYSVKFFGKFVRVLPLTFALFIGRLAGTIYYCFDLKHKRQVYANLKTAFADTKSPHELKKITKELFQNFGQNIIEMFRLPLLNTDKFKDLIEIEGKEYVEEAYAEKKGVILLAMHFGSWELASLSCAMFDMPYKVFVKPQDKHTRLSELLNSYRTCDGSVVLTRGNGTRELVSSLKKNEIIGMVVDQGGRDGMLVPFFGKQASMSVGAIRLAMKRDVPICFAIVIRQKNGKHKMILHKKLDLRVTGNQEKDLAVNLRKVVKKMEDYIVQYPSEYMWPYKIWKYSNEADITILSDEKVGHLRQSEAVAMMCKKALKERNITAKISYVTVAFKSSMKSKALSLLGVIMSPFFILGRSAFLKYFLTQESYEALSKAKSDFVISTGSSIAVLNYLLSQDLNAKGIVVLKPGMLNFKKFDLVVLPKHDIPSSNFDHDNVVVTHAAPNLISQRYIKKQQDLLLHRFSHLKTVVRFKIAVFIGGNSKKIYLSTKQIKILIQQLKSAAKELNAVILMTTSRRTPKKIEKLLVRNFKKDPACALFVNAAKDDISEAVGGITGLSDVIVVSGDSISMVSEAASSGKNTIVFLPESKAKIIQIYNKHKMFVEKLNAKGYVLSTDVTRIGQTISNVAKNKIRTRKIDDNVVILDAVRDVI